MKTLDGIVCIINQGGFVVLNKWANQTSGNAIDVRLFNGGITGSI